MIRRPILLNIAQCMDAIELLRSLPGACTPLVFFDPQHRGVLDHLKFGNEGARQRGRSKLPAMTDEYIDACCREIARVLRPSGYLMLWVDTFCLCEAHHLRIADALKAVDLIACAAASVPGMVWGDRDGSSFRIHLRRRASPCVPVMGESGHNRAKTRSLLVSPTPGSSAVQQG